MWDLCASAADLSSVCHCLCFSVARCVIQWPQQTVNVGCSKSHCLSITFKVKWTMSCCCMDRNCIKNYFVLNRNKRIKTLRWVNNDRNFTFEWTVPLTNCSLLSCIVLPQNPEALLAHIVSAHWWNGKRKKSKSINLLLITLRQRNISPRCPDLIWNGPWNSDL